MEGKDLNKKLSEMWDELGAEEKTGYEEKAKTLKVMDMDDYADLTTPCRMRHGSSLRRSKRKSRRLHHRYLLHLFGCSA